MAVIPRAEAENVGLKVEKKEEGPQRKTERSHRDWWPLSRGWHRAPASQPWEAPLLLYKKAAPQGLKPIQWGLVETNSLT